jgi:hypothetical protein
MKQSVGSHFFKNPHAIYEIGLKPKEIAVLGYLISIMEFKYNHPSRSTIGKVCGMTISTVDKTIKSLVSKKLLIYEKGHTGLSNRYKVLLNNIDPKCVFKAAVEPEEFDSIEFSQMIHEAVSESEQSIFS